MTENEKIELFDKWYDENYDEWAEGEEGIALREELEQAFKAGIAELEQENKVLAQNLEDTEILNKALEKENERLTDELKSLRESIKDYGAGCYENGHRTGKRKFEEQLTKAKELLRYYFDCFKNDNKYTLSDFEVVEDTEQFLNEVEK